MRRSLAIALVPAVVSAGCGSKDDANPQASASADGGDDTGADDGSGASGSGDGGSGDGGSGDGGSGDGGTDGGDQGDGGDSGGGFVQEPDGGTDSECDPKLQDCADDQKCTAWANDGGNAWNANKCVDVTGTGVGGDMCMIEGTGVSGLDDCAKGFICMLTDEMGIGVCVKFCTTENEDCDPGDICAIYNDGVLPICLDMCDPLLQDCPDMQACIDTPNGNFICFTDASGTSGAYGDVCPARDGENSCDPGMWCGQGSAGCPDVKCCTPFCDLSAGDPSSACNSPDECVSFYGDPANAPPMYGDIGVCVTP